MTSRERWTVYPLLFLAIGMAVRAAIVADEDRASRVDSLDTGQIVCRELIVTGTDGTVLVHLGRVVGDGGGRIEIKDAAGVDSIAIGTRPDRRTGSVEFFDDQGEPTGSLGPGK
jgi:hypothetical protein